MIVFADHCVHTDVIKALTDIGIKVERAIDKGLSSVPDEEIFNYILKNSRLLLTFDKDFGNIIRFNIRGSQGIVIVYVEEMSRKEIIRRITEFFRGINAKQLKGNLFIIKPAEIRVWPH